MQNLPHIALIRKENRQCVTLARRAVEDECGNMSVLTIGVMVVVLMVIAFGAALTGVEIDRNRVQFVADGAALYASSSFNERQVYGEPSGGGIEAPTDADARTRVNDYLAHYPVKHPRIRTVQAQEVHVYPDGRVRVVLKAHTTPPLVGWISDSLDVPITISVESEAHTH